MYTNTHDEKFWHLPTEELEVLLDTDIERGLSSTEATERLKTVGRNSFQSSKRAPALKIFLRQFMSPLILILIGAAIVTIVIAHYRDAFFILITVVANSFLGFWQENKAEQALSELKTYLKQRARVVREGKEREIDSEELVPGDLLRLSQGDRVPADARILYVNDLQIDESILTGESLPVAKAIAPDAAAAPINEQHSMLFAGTLVTQGVCSALVCNTADKTELGKIAALIGTSHSEQTPLQQAISKFSLKLSALLGLLTVAVFVIGIMSGRPLLEMFLTSVAIAISAIPEGLPVSMTVILAVGVERMAKRKGVVRKLIAAETLGSATVILTDKTGTLTTAQMALSQIISVNESSQALLAHALTNADVLIENPEDLPEEWRMNGRLMEVSLVRSAANRGMPLDEITDKKHVLQSMPFNSVQKFSVSLTKTGSKHQLVFFGAPDILLTHSSLGDDDKVRLLQQIHAIASAGERVLGVATKTITHAENFSFSKDLKLEKLSFGGLITFNDPVRPGIKHAIARIKQAGVRTVILTGDYYGTAVAVAKQLGMPIDAASVMDAAELSQLSDEELAMRLPHISVISRVTPVEKLRIAKLFQASGEVIAMTGDGVNDAPSIKQADVGIAMGSGTEVAQSVADLVLLDNNYETIVAAIEEGRQIMGNIRKVLVYLLSNIADELILIGGSILVGVALPMNALQILWVNFFSDSFPAVAFAFEKDPDGLAHKPAGKNLELFDPLMKFLVMIIGVLTSALLFVLYIVLLKLGHDEQLVRTFIFAAFGTYTLLVALSVRGLHRSIFSYSLFSNHYLTGGIGIGIVLMAMAIYVPGLQSLFGTIALPLPWVLGVLAVGVVNIALIEVAKAVFSEHSHSLAQRTA